MSDSEFTIQRQLDEICNEFEEQWVASGQAAKLRPFLERVAGDHRDHLLKMLIDVDIELRQKAGESVSPDDYSELGDDVVARIVESLVDSDVTIPPNREPAQDLPTTAPQSSSKSSKRQIGPYKLLRELGKGGMGEVWLAEQADPYRQVALKLVQTGRVQSEDQHRQFIARFEAERQALAMMSHTNIAKVFDGGTTDEGQPYFVMEYFSGVPLTKYCDNKRLGIKERLEIFVDVCRAVHHAHQKGIIHRDLKPDNILVTEVDDKPVPKVIDFGLAKSLQSTAKLTDKTIVSEVGIPLGTWQYMSPEQAGSDGMDVDTRTDIYALGAILYEILTGSPPIERETLANKMWIQMMELIQNFEPNRPSERLSSCAVETKDSISSSRSVEASKLYSELKGELDWIVLKALEKDRSRRYGTASDFAKDVDNYLSGETVEARPPSTGYRISKFIRKNRGLVGTTTAIGALLILGVIGTSYGLYRANKNAHRAEQNAIRAESREQQAIDAVKRFRDAVIENPDLKNNPSLDSLRETLLQEPLAFFKSFRMQLQEEKGTQPKSLQSLAEVASELGDLSDEIGDKQNALEAYEESRTIYERLLVNEPSKAEFQFNLSGCHNDIGRLLYVTGQPTAALAAYNEAMLIRERLVAAYPTVTEYQNGLAGVKINIANLLFKTGKPNESLEVQKKAVAILELVVAAHPTDAKCQLFLSRGQRGLGVNLKASGQRREALVAFQRSREFCERLVAANPTVAKYQNDLALSLDHIGSLLSDTNQTKEAMSAFEKAKDIHERLAAGNPSVTLYKSSLANNHRCIGVLLKQAGRPKEALDAYGKAKQIFEHLVAANPTATVYQSELANSLANLGVLLLESDQPESAMEAFEQEKEIVKRLVAASPTVTKHQSDLASCHNRIGNWLRENDQPEAAMAAFEQQKEILEGLVAANPGVIGYRYDLAGNHLSIGGVQYQAGRPEKALAAFERAKGIFARLADANPAVTSYQGSVGGALNNMAMIHLKSKRFAEARDLLLDAIKSQKKALSENPNNPTYRNYLRKHYENLLETAIELEDKTLAAEARQWLMKEAIARYEADLSLKKKQLGEDHPDTILTMNNIIWDKARSPVVSEKLLNEKDLESIRKICRKHPQGIYFNTLAFAEYRLGNLDESIEAALKSAELTPKELELSGPHPGDLAILAMSYYKTGESKKADHYRQQLNEAMELDAFRDDEECKSFLTEVDALFDQAESDDGKEDK